jgi:hypothetical protein
MRMGDYAKVGVSSPKVAVPQLCTVAAPPQGGGMGSVIEVFRHFQPHFDRAVMVKRANDIFFEQD